MRTFDSDLLEVLEATDGRSNSGALPLKAFHHERLGVLEALKRWNRSQNPRTLEPFFSI